MWNVLSQGQGHEVKNYGYARKVLSQEMQMSMPYLFWLECYGQG